MAIVIKIKPVKVTAKTKMDVIRKIEGYTGYRNAFISNGRFLVKRGADLPRDGLARLYSLEKHNLKVQVTKRTITRGKRKGEVEVTRRVVREAMWVAHYYDVPVDMLDGKATRQNNRNFTLKLK
jgi:hypothetical protein